MSDLKTVLSRDFDQALARVAEVLKEEGFGILTEVDVTDTLKKKLDVDFRPYRILGACNPPLAHRGLQANLDVGLMMPCNVIVYAADGGGTTVVAIDPTDTAPARTDGAVHAVAAEVRARLARVIARLAA